MNFASGSTLLGAFILGSTIPAFAQAAPSCPQGVQQGITTNPAYIGTQQPFSLVIQVCPPNTNVFFRVGVSNNAPPYYTLNVTVPTDAGGAARVPIAGLPAGFYQVAANYPGDGNGNLSLFSSFTVGGGAAAAALHGQYAFLLQGISGLSGPGISNQSAVIGSFTADGQGNIIGGIADLNAPRAAAPGFALTGKYILENNGRGTVMLNTPFGSQILSISVPTAQTFAKVQSATLTALKPGAFVGSGTLALQDPASFSKMTTQTADYAFRLTGESACNSSCVAGGQQALPIAVTGLESFNPTSFTPVVFTYDQSFGTTVQATLQEAYTVQAADQNGRSLLPSKMQQGPDGSPATLVEYQIDATHLFLLSLDPHSQAILLSGSAQR